MYNLQSALCIHGSPFLDSAMDSALCVHGLPFLDSANRRSCSRCIYCWRKFLYMWIHTVQTRIVHRSTTVCDSQFPRGGDTPHLEGTQWEEAGLVRRQREGRAWGKGCDFQGGNGQGKVIRFRIEYLNNFGGFWITGWSLAVWPWDDYGRRMLPPRVLDRGGRWGCGLRIGSICIKVVL